MKKQKLNYNIAFDGNVVSKEEQLKLFAKLIFCLYDLNESAKLKNKGQKLILSFMVGHPGLEPGTLRLSGVRSNHLS